MAAGMKAKQENIEALRERLDKYADEIIPKDERTPEVLIDAVVTTETLSLKLVEDLASFEPFGAGNPKPVFLTKNLTLRDEPFVMKDKHLKLKLFDEKGKQFEAVWWDGVAKSKEQTLKPNSRIELAYVAAPGLSRPSRGSRLRESAASRHHQRPRPERPGR